LKEVAPLHKTTFLKTVIRNNPIFAKNWGYDQFFDQFFNNQQNFQIIGGMQPNYLGIYPPLPINSRFVTTNFKW